MIHKARLRRVELSVPGSSPKMMAKAAGLGADVVIFDLEDSVTPAQKAAARAEVCATLNSVDFGLTTPAVRVNAPGTPWCHDDIIELLESVGDRVEVIVVPKVTSPRDVWYVDTLLDELEVKLRVPGRIALELVIEEASGLGRVEKIAACCDRIEALVLGFGDLAASLGMRAEVDGPGTEGAAARYPGDIWHAPRSRLVAAARANGLAPIDGPFLDYADIEGLRRESRMAAAMGSMGRWAIHPSQIAVAQSVFAPTAKEVARAREAVAAMNQAEASGAGAAGLDGKMLDAATSRLYREVIDRADQIENLEQRRAR